MRIAVLGAAAGGGFPQWNSNGRGCNRARAGDPQVRPRTQAGLAVSGDGDAWILINASPDLRQQIGQLAFLHPREGLRSTPISAVVLTGGDVDAIAGLLTLRERQAFDLFATKTVHDILVANPIFEVLNRQFVQRRQAELDRPVSLAGGLAIELFAVPGKTPLYLETDDAPPIVEDGTTVGAAIVGGGRRAYFIPGCAAMTPGLARRLRGADLVLFDGTLYADDEMVAGGLSPKTGRRMGHMSMSGPDGSMAAFEGLDVGRKIFVHINNSNPVLMEDSPEHARVVAAGWEVAHDGMEIIL